MEKQNELYTKTAEVLHKVEELAPRITALLTIANKCVQEGVSFPSASETKKYGYGDGHFNFCSDGIRHHVGFMDTACGGYIYKKKGTEIKYLGIDEGGYCGPWDFYTNGTESFLRHERIDITQRKDAELIYLQAFLAEFDQFEESFYKWIDSLAE